MDLMYTTTRRFTRPIGRGVRVLQIGRYSLPEPARGSTEGASRVDSIGGSQTDAARSWSRSGSRSTRPRPRRTGANGWVRLEDRPAAGHGWATRPDPVHRARCPGRRPCSKRRPTMVSPRRDKDQHRHEEGWPGSCEGDRRGAPRRTPASRTRSRSGSNERPARCAAIRSAWVRSREVQVGADGSVTGYQVNMLVTFVLD